MNFLPAGESCNWNLGWDKNEGAHCYPPALQQCDKVGALLVVNYNHSEGDCSITGMGVYRGQESASLDGNYFNSDFCSGKIYGLMRDQSGTWNYQVLLQTSLKVTGSGQDANGELYLTACSCEYGRDYNPMDNPGGTVWRVVQSDKVPQGAVTAPTPEATGTPGATQATPAAAQPATMATTASSPAAGGTKGRLRSPWSISPSSRTISPSPPIKT